MSCSTVTQASGNRMEMTEAELSQKLERARTIEAAAVLFGRYKAELEQAAAREAALQTVVDDLCEQYERQEDMEEAGHRSSYPSKFPDWERVWEQAREVRYSASEAAAALLERLEKAEAREGALVNSALTWRAYAMAMEEAYNTGNCPSDICELSERVQEQGKIDPSAAATALLERLGKAEDEVVHLLAAVAEVREAPMTLSLERMAGDVITEHQEGLLLKALEKLGEATMDDAGAGDCGAGTWTR